jgi:hypothetical protein
MDNSAVEYFTVEMASSVFEIDAHVDIIISGTRTVIFP